MTSKKTSDSSRWASIRKRQRTDGSMSYTVLYWQDGKQSPLTFRDEPSAEAFKLAIKAHGVRRALEMHGYEIRAAESETPELTVAEWIRHHIDHLTGIEQYTLDVYERYLKNDIAPTLGLIPLAQLSEEDIALWVKGLETTIRPKTGRVLKPKSIHNLHGFLSGALGAAVPKHIPANPAAGRRLPRTTGDATEGEDDDDLRMLTHAEFAKLYEAIIEAYQPMLRFMVASGARWGEVTALKPGDINREEGTVRIRRAWKYSPTKGYYIGATKTVRSDRTINVSVDLLNDLEYDGQPYVFQNAHGGPVRYQAFRPIWDRAVAKAKLDPAPTPHALRHTCASWMLASNIPLTTVSRHLGHESIKVTADLYTHVDRAAHQAAADAMAAILAQ
ncbi:tyrosine-type recombinase/integrase [Mycobacterium sp.]|uniref:tyrosine-type recombinase/integrase n=1 Tax=Mycobacterium sp. TaxID=1785 RepID=UPI003F976540